MEELKSVQTWDNGSENRVEQKSGEISMLIDETDNDKLSSTTLVESDNTPLRSSGIFRPLSAPRTPRSLSENQNRPTVFGLVDTKERNVMESHKDEEIVELDDEQLFEDLDEFDELELAAKSEPKLAIIRTSGALSEALESQRFSRTASSQMLLGTPSEHHASSAHKRHKPGKNPSHSESPRRKSRGRGVQVDISVQNSPLRSSSSSIYGHIGASRSASRLPMSPPSPKNQCATQTPNVSYMRTSSTNSVGALGFSRNGAESWTPMPLENDAYEDEDSDIEESSKQKLFTGRQHSAPNGDEPVVKKRSGQRSGIAHVKRATANNQVVASGKMINASNQQKVSNKPRIVKATSLTAAAFTVSLRASARANKQSSPELRSRDPVNNPNAKATAGSAAMKNFRKFKEKIHAAFT
uniref:Uncharacterized protein n=1 Tax=Timspurckia oligopyrenoides TaxID=708627 RepID=A0A7S1ERN7_9RHOD|mmetsp:Transcript_3180/g.5602  ORF Transcript_3180/g.5602 Transcript_3180/m.5602 type:complete len:411 (+) Transcript_3180:102-1334(+)|eukprot:CAMPEP_0182447838 /NCGR_PEP_ID=MMETSP1172-20130603/20740_1 /TAXON_ID=708627 /ORGANISM="Timspurckia oligopyrenoides, Strain CCMP3278" /LENGTH=410 /DNA_ID=CAMNT_0024644439 /DNA_START=47 /DNA_END=1279 /DNA_ORIENTATION=-